jgi:sulfur-oxidizing protein SoxB
LKPLYHREPWDADYESMARREGRLGGFAHVATLVKKLRGEKPERTLLLDAGDTWHGTGVAVFDGGATIVNVMNALKYDAMAPGNVDFLFPKDVVMARVKQARFPVIAANWTDNDTERSSGRTSSRTWAA